MSGSTGEQAPLPARQSASTSSLLTKNPMHGQGAVVRPSAPPGPPHASSKPPSLGTVAPRMGRRPTLSSHEGLGFGRQGGGSSSQRESLDFTLKPVSHLTVNPRFLDPNVERAYRDHRSELIFTRLRRLLPLMYSWFVVLAGIGFFAMALPNGWEIAYRSAAVGDRLMKVAIGNGPGLVAGAAVIFGANRYPAFFRQQMMEILTLTTVVTAGSVFLSTVDFIHPQMVFFPAMWAFDMGARGVFCIPPTGLLVCLLVMNVLVWTVYPALGIVSNFSEYYGMIIITLGVIPVSILNGRGGLCGAQKYQSLILKLTKTEDDIRRRREFARLSRDAAERAGLLAQNAGLHDMLRSLQRRADGGGVDVDSPLTKAVDALVGLRCDPRLPEWAVPVIDDAVSHLLASGSIVLPDLGGLVRDGALQLDRDVGRWLFSEVVPGQREAAAQFGPGEGLVEAVEGPSAREMPSLEPSLGRPSGDSLGPARSPLVAAPPRPLADEVDRQARRLALSISTWEEGDTRAIEAATGGAPLLAVCLAACRESGLLHRVGVPVERFAAFVAGVEEGYNPNPYHNRAHAADVTRSMAFLLTGGGMGAHLSDLEQLAALVACALHDYEHNGVNNNFLVNTGAPLAILYNDRSPLESHHVAGAWKLLRSAKHDFLAGLPKGSRRELRRLVIDMVLATDMAQHFEILGNFRKRAAAGFLAPGAERRPGTGPGISPSRRRGSGSSGGTLELAVPGPRLPGGSSPGPSSPRAGAARPKGSPEPPPPPPPRLAAMPRTESTVRMRALRPSGPPEEGEEPPLPPPEQLQADDRRLILCAAIKACDIGHAAKPQALHVHWSGAIQEEFFAQGDRERALGLEVSPFMDRSVGNFPKSQIGFLDFVALPLFRAFVSIFPAAAPITEHAAANYQYWVALAEAPPPPPPAPPVKAFLAGPEPPEPPEPPGPTPQGPSPPSPRV